MKFYLLQMLNKLQHLIFSCKLNKHNSSCEWKNLTMWKLNYMGSTTFWGCHMATESRFEARLALRIASDLFWTGLEIMGAS
jgi:hypothetical protein